MWVNINFLNKTQYVHNNNQQMEALAKIQTQDLSLSHIMYTG